MIRHLHFEAPMSPASMIALADGRVVQAAEAAQAIVRAPALIPDEALSSQVTRAMRGDLVLPGAERWRTRVAAARPTDPVRVPALERNARVVEIEMARDALADPWNPSRFADHDGVNVSVMGAASREWRAGLVEFDVLVGDADRQVVRYRLTEQDRRRLWEHLTGLVRAMRIEAGQVTLESESDERPWRGATPTATAGVVGPAIWASYLYDGAPADGVWIREDGAFRRDQEVRTDVAEHNAWLIRQWRAESGLPSVAQLVSIEAYDAAGGQDDLAAGVRSMGIGTVMAVGFGAATAAGAIVLARSQRARDKMIGWLSAIGGDS